jgi:heme O synthase-like polyprenyltransferase
MAVPDIAEALTAAPGRGLVGAGTVVGWRDYVTLTKPRIMSLLVLTAVCAMIAAARGDPAPLPLAALMLGGALSCGGASALNHVLDRDIDRLMGPRTASRPVAAGRISPARALAWRLRRRTDPANAALVFHYSLLYLALLFAAVAVDAALR